MLVVLALALAGQPPQNCILSQESFGFAINLTRIPGAIGIAEGKGFIISTCAAIEAPSLCKYSTESECNGWIWGPDFACDCIGRHDNATYIVAPNLLTISFGGFVVKVVCSDGNEFGGYQGTVDGVHQFVWYFNELCPGGACAGFPQLEEFPQFRKKGFRKATDITKQWEWQGNRQIDSSGNSLPSFVSPCALILPKHRSTFANRVPIQGCMASDVSDHCLAPYEEARWELDTSPSSGKITGIKVSWSNGIEVFIKCGKKTVVPQNWLSVDESRSKWSLTWYSATLCHGRTSIDLNLTNDRETYSEMLLDSELNSLEMLFADRGLVTVNELRELVLTLHRKVQPVAALVLSNFSDTDEISFDEFAFLMTEASGIIEESSDE